MSNQYICVLCCLHINRKLGYYNIVETSIDSSKKTIKNILMHLSKCIKTDCCFEDSACVCNPCYEKIEQYDQIMVQLLFYQKSLTQMLENSIQFFNDIKTNDGNDCVKEDYTDNIEFKDSGSNVSVKSEQNETDDFDNLESESENEMEEDGPTPSFNCSICDKVLRTQKSLNRHLESHGNAVKCNICGALRKDEEYLELHMNVHEGKTENDCRYCPKRYSRRANVIRHMHLHWDKKKFQCEKCGLRFSQANILYNHKLVHEAEEQPIICQICDQSFKSRKTFKHHMVTHQEDRPRHPCEICGKKFTERYTLKMHLKTHSRDEEYEQSKKSFSQAKKCSNQTKKFVCIICEKEFGNMENLDSHKAKEHDVICSDSVFLNLF